MKSTVVQVLEVGLPNPVLLFSDTGRGDRFVVGSLDDVSGDTLPRLYDAWERISISSDEQAPGLRVRYLVNGEPADEDVTYLTTAGHISVTADSKCYLCVCKREGSEPLYIVFGSFRDREWIYDPFSREVATVTGVQVRDGAVWYDSSGVPRRINSKVVYDYSTGERILGTPLASATASPG